jgi:two-component system CheB/CheR fusion protein
LTTLLSKLPEDTGMAFVLVVGASSPSPRVFSMGESLGPQAPLTGPAAPSLPQPTRVPLVELLGTTTTMPVVEAEDQVRVEPDRVYVAPPNATVTFADGRLAVGPSTASAARPIDVFLRSLALDRRSRALGVILGAVGADGALGIRTIKEAGGIAFAQDAQWGTRDAAQGCVDFTLPPEEIAAEVAGVAQRLRAAYTGTAAATVELDDDALVQQIFAVLRAERGVDFMRYRQTTVKRRILRRMVLGGAQTLREYLGVLRERPGEMEALYQDLLIRVTHFFRDPEVFEVIARRVFPALIEAHLGEAPLRLWVPGCSTGEEAYSLAIALVEVADRTRAEVPFQVFATDIGEASLEIARSGTYIENISMDVSPERLRRFFVRTGSEYQIAQSIRDHCVFARHDLTRDPPFSRLDLISCRNVLLYLEPALRRRIFAMFHHALKPSGHLLLGASEAVGGLSELFPVVDRKSKIYARSAGSSRLAVDLRGRLGSGPGASAHRSSYPSREDGVAEQVQKTADRLVMERYAPPGVVVDAELEIVQFRGHTGPYLDPTPGAASLHLLKMARKGLVLELRAAIHKALRTDAPARAEGLKVVSEGVARAVNVEVVPLPAESERWFLVLFEEQATPRTRGRASGGEDARAAQLERELLTTKEYLQVTLAEQEATTEELKAANEELLSSNEELQSINEELEATQEEQQAANERLSTLNQELRERNGDLERRSGEIGNLVASAEIPIVMVGTDLATRRFTPPAHRLLGLVEGDIGRPIGAILTRIVAHGHDRGSASIPPLRADLERLVAGVIDGARPPGERAGAPTANAPFHEREVQDREGRWYSMRIRPCFTTSGGVDGAVIVFVDIEGIHGGLPEDDATSVRVRGGSR